VNFCDCETVTDTSLFKVATIQIPQGQFPNGYYHHNQVPTTTGFITVPNQIFTISSNTIHQEPVKPLATEAPAIVNDEMQQSETRLFKCNACPKEFKQKGTLMQHERIHLDYRPYSCQFEDCKSRFRQQSHLIQHSRIHIDSKPFSCSFEGCTKRFRQRAILNQHMRIHCG